MAINLELKNELDNNTRRLGTRADSYLDAFFDAYFNNDTLENLEDFIDESGKKDKSAATKKQIEEIFSIFKIIDEEKNIIIKNFDSKESFQRILTENLKKTLENIENINFTHKNTYKLVNNIIYIHGVGIISKSESKILNEIFDSSMEKRTSELKINNIIMDSELEKIIKLRLKILLESCDYEFNELEELHSYIKEEIKNMSIDEDKINEFRNRIENDTKNIIELIKMTLDNTTKLVIPFYQREYVWSQDLIENFLKEIISNKNSSLNIGNILISISGSGSVRKYAVVDGQQRLTSIILITNILSKLLSKIDLNKFHLEDELKIIVKETKNSNFIKNLENESNLDYINDLKYVLDCDLENIHKDIKSKSIIKKNYSLIYPMIDDLDDSSKINLLRKLSYIFSIITFDDLSDEIELFMSTNSSRKPLSNYDLIRSLVISKVSGDPKKINKKITEITTLLEFNGERSEKAEDIFFKFYLDYNDKISLNDSSKNKNIFKRFSEVILPRISKDKDIIILLDDLIDVLNSYRVSKGVDEIKNIYLKDFLLSLSGTLKVTSIYEIFIVYFIQELKKVGDEKKQNILLNEFRRILLLIERFEIKWKLFNFRGDSLSSVMGSLFSEFLNHSEELIKEERYEELYSKFRYISEEKEGFFNKVLYNENVENIETFLSSDNISSNENALKILNRVAFVLFNNNEINYKPNSTIYFEHEKPSIEHVFPKANSKWREDNKTNCFELEPHLEDIGNKFIFNKIENTSAGNKKFIDKIKKYKDYNNISIDKTLDFEYNGKDFSLLEKEEWKVEDIELRSKYIISELIKLWNDH